MPLPAFFPCVRPGELIYSALARHSVAMGALGPKGVMSALFGKANAIATMDLPNNLGALVERLPPGLGIDAETLAWEHTLFPYYARFQQPDVAHRALHAMVNSGGAIHLMLGINTFRTGRPSHLQFCAACSEGMLIEFGSLHWRCAHQLPGVLVCPDHGEILRRSSVRLVANNRHEFIAASEETCASGGEPLVATLDDDEIAGAVAIARASAALLWRPTTPRLGVELLSEYHDALRAAGLMKGRFKVNQRELAFRLEQHWGKLLDQFDGVRLKDCNESWLASLVRTSKGAQPPLQHLLLQIFLEAQPAVPPSPTRINTPRHRPFRAGRAKPAIETRLDWQTIDASYARELRRGASAIYKMEPPSRVTLAAVERLIGRRDWLSKRRRKLPRSCAATLKIQESVRSFQMRRLRWHGALCRAEGLFDPWILLRRAGLRESLIQAAREELGPLDIVPILQAAA
ncbi:TnsD family Tn7-like transposition protein [Sphingomonas arantia]|uniref:TnsD family Tn7-like transposition protein n=1 Tax=Sphingomonas arantia TaxID=1460676 RepID=A0ABW4TYL6_9SPHN